MYFDCRLRYAVESFKHKEAQWRWLRSLIQHPLLSQRGRFQIERFSRKKLGVWLQQVLTLRVVILIDRFRFSSFEMQWWRQPQRRREWMVASENDSGLSLAITIKYSCESYLLTECWKTQSQFFNSHNSCHCANVLSSFELVLKMIKNKVNNRFRKSFFRKLTYQVNNSGESRKTKRNSIC